MILKGIFLFMDPDPLTHPFILIQSGSICFFGRRKLPVEPSIIDHRKNLYSRPMKQRTYAQCSTYQDRVLHKQIYYRDPNISYITTDIRNLCWQSPIWLVWISRTCWRWSGSRGRLASWRWGRTSPAAVGAVGFPWPSPPCSPCRSRSEQRRYLIYKILKQNKITAAL